jgi:hypothetical protein
MRPFGGTLVLLVVTMSLSSQVTAQLSGFCDAGDDARLQQLVVQGDESQCVLSPAFDPAVHYYTCQLPATTDTVTVLPYSLASRTEMEVQVRGYVYAGVWCGGGLRVCVCEREKGCVREREGEKDRTCL